MKKILILCLMLTFTVPVRAEDCANGAGTVVSRNNIRFCQSKPKMNWYSANAWCKALNMPMISIKKDVPPCNYSWYQDLADPQTSYYLQSNCQLTKATLTSSLFAICKMN